MHSSSLHLASAWGGSVLASMVGNWVGTERTALHRMWREELMGPRGRSQYHMDRLAENLGSLSVLLAELCHYES